MCRYAQVIIHFAKAIEIDRVFTYKIDTRLEEQVKLGHRVKVPFGKYNKLQIGYVIALLEDFEEGDYPIKTIESIVEEMPLLSPGQLDLMHAMVRYYGISYAAAIDVMLPAGMLHQSLSQVEETQQYLVLANEERAKAYIEENKHKKTFLKQGYLLEYLLKYPKVLRKDVEALPQVSLSALKTLMKHQLVIQEYQLKQTVKNTILNDAFQLLNQEQLDAKNHIIKRLHEDKYHTILLQGITGSGKTEVFLYAIKEVIERGDMAIVLVPEIALTRQTLIRFEQRFGNQVALTHSRMTPKERQRLYLKAKKGEISVIIGPRSAVFMPFENLKLIVIDEEHELTYKSESFPKYHAIDVAQMRMQSENGIVLLASATPSIETYYHCLNKRYDHIKLNHRIGDASLPEVITVDMRLELQKGNNQVISQKLHEEIHHTLQQNQQVMILINRRGYASFVNCRSCGHVIKCTHCDVSMTYHASTHTLECHYCGKSILAPSKCPSCDSKYIRFLGSGTEKVETYLRQYFEQYGVARMDLDTTTGKTGHHDILEAFEQRKINLLIGTQMIAKGHDFKAVTLVGIVSADLSLYMQDFRSHEKTFQLITQAMGRAGRGEVKGKVVIQTYHPEHIVLEHIKRNTGDLFYQEEIKNRQMMGYPPFSHLFTLLITGKDESTVIETAHALARYYQYYSQKAKETFRVIGPSAAVIQKVSDEYRWRIIVLSDNRDKLMIYGKYCLEKFKMVQKDQTIKIQWDIDPLTMP